MCLTVYCVLPYRSWTLDHISEIVYLATHVQMLEQVEAALLQHAEGNNEALKVSTNLLTTGVSVMFDNLWYNYMFACS